MLLRTAEQLVKEIRDTISSREPMVRATVSGKLYFVRSALETKMEADHSPIVWILQAHLGTIDKLKGIFNRDGDYETFELLAVARNLFENLIWLRLFGRDVQYGLIFYEQLLIQQKQNTESMIRKVDSEIALFEEYGRLDSENFDISYSKFLNDDNPSQAEIQNAQESHRALTEALDMRVRRRFALYAAAAKFNSYEYQCHILRNSVLPSHRSQLADIQASLASYNNVKEVLLSPKMLSESNRRWRWNERAKEVGMQEQYEFLYSYTSKLLHSTPMNIITEKSLSTSEAITMLDYAYIAACDLLDAIDAFSFPGQVDAIAIEVQ